MPKTSHSLMHIRPDTTLAELVPMLVREFADETIVACRFELPGLERREGRHQPVTLAFEVRLHRVQ